MEWGKELIKNEHDRGWDGEMRVLKQRRKEKGRLDKRARKCRENC
jgi:hypothetical protein